MSGAVASVNDANDANHTIEVAAVSLTPSLAEWPVSLIRACGHALSISFSRGATECIGRLRGEVRQSLTHWRDDLVRRLSVRYRHRMSRPRGRA